MGDMQNVGNELMHQAAMDALKRWQDRTAIRETGLAKIRRQGLGAADSVAQQQAHQIRETKKVLLRTQERIVGPTVDFSFGAPGERARKVAASVARLVRLPGGGYDPRPLATGFLVGPGLLLTNHHVFPRKVDAYQAAANFGYVQDERGIQKGSLFLLDADRFYLSDETLDIALVAVAAAGVGGERLDELGFSRLIAATGKILTGMPVNIIQHPSGQPRTFAVTNNRLLDILPEGFLHYETDTLEGSSGSPLHNEDWELIGIHHAGIPKVVDGQVMTKSGRPFDDQVDTDNDIVWIANEGARVSAIVQRLSEASLATESERKIVASLLALSADELRVETGAGLLALNEAMASTGINPQGVSMTHNQFLFTGAVTINVMPPSAPIQSPPAGAERADVAPAIVAVELKQSFDPDYTQRAGYDEDFLGVPVPLPTSVHERATELYTVADYQHFAANDRGVPEIDTTDLDATSAFLLHYYHYTLCFNKEYRMCMWTASNVDYSAAQRQDPRVRKQFGDESWTADPRVPIELQLKDADIYGPGKRIDRGHIVRREDNCWGAAGDETAFANADTYHWTNCTAQHEAFNQENPKDNYTKSSEMYKGQKGDWGQFESIVQKNLQNGGGQAIIFAGPVLQPSELLLVEVAGVEIAVPSRFWKVVVVPASTARRPKLLAYGYVLSQVDAIKRYGLQIQEALTVPPEFEKMQKSIADITAMTGVKFDDVVHAADQFGK